MPKRKTPLQRLAEAVAEVGIEKAGEHFEFLKAMKKPEPKVRKPRKADHHGAIKVVGGPE